MSWVLLGSLSYRWGKKETQKGYETAPAPHSSPLWSETQTALPGKLVQGNSNHGCVEGMQCPHQGAVVCWGASDFREMAGGCSDQGRLWGKLAFEKSLEGQRSLGRQEV